VAWANENDKGTLGVLFEFGYGSYDKSIGFVKWGI